MSTPLPDRATIERLVAEVIVRLQSVPRPAVAATVPVPASSSHGTPEASSNHGAPTAVAAGAALADKVITLAAIERFDLDYAKTEQAFPLLDQPFEQDR